MLQCCLFIVALVSSQVTATPAEASQKDSATPPGPHNAPIRIAQADTQGDVETAPDAEGIKRLIRRRPRSPALENAARAQVGRTAPSADSAAASGAPTDAPNPSPTAVPPGGVLAPAANQPASPTVRAGRARRLDAAKADEADDSKTTEIDFEARERKGKFSFDFAKAEITDIIKAISDMTRKNFIVPEKIKGQRITILSPTKITAAEAYQVFIAALAANGITLVRVGKFYKLVEAKESIKSTIPTCLAGEECPEFYDQMVTELLPLSHVDGNQIINVVKTLISKEGEVQLFPPTNALIIAEFGPNLTRIKRIIAALDVPGYDDELRIVQVQYATATELSDKLTQIFEVTARGAGATPMRGSRRRAADGAPPGAPVLGGGDEGSEDVQISKIIPDDRTNQLIIKANRRSFAAIERLLAKLDVPISESEQGKVHVYYLENASAEDLASTLSSLAQGGQQNAAQTPPRRRAMGTDPMTGAPVNMAAPGGGPPESAVLFEGDVKITADKATNALIVVASPHDFRAVRALIEKLDVPRPQVYVEAAILEVNVSGKNDFGLQWHAPIRGVGDPGSFGFAQSSFTTGGLSPTIAALSSPQSLLGVAGGSVAGILGKGIDIPVGTTNVSLPSFGVILKWLQASSNTNVISTPHILTTDNEEASIEVGEKIPFVRGTALPALGGLGGTAGLAGGAAGAAGLGGLGNLGSLFSSTDRIDVKLTLNITPHINERNKIRLEIDQQIEDVSGKDEQTQQPKTSSRAAKTVVVVDDQQTVVLGGLMRDRARDSESKIPILGDLPLIGWLFKQRSTENEKVNLLLVLTPYIIREADDFQRLFERKVAEHEEFAAEFYGHLREYRAHIDYARKRGPFAALSNVVRTEMAKTENGGSGEGTLLIKPRTNPAPESNTKEDVKGEAPPVDVPKSTEAMEPLPPPDVPLHKEAPEASEKDSGPPLFLPRAEPLDQPTDKAPAPAPEPRPAPDVGPPPVKEGGGEDAPSEGSPKPAPDTAPAPEQNNGAPAPEPNNAAPAPENQSPAPPATAEGASP